MSKYVNSKYTIKDKDDNIPVKVDGKVVLKKYEPGDDVVIGGYTYIKNLLLDFEGYRRIKVCLDDPQNLTFKESKDRPKEDPKEDLRKLLASNNKD